MLAAGILPHPLWSRGNWLFSNAEGPGFKLKLGLLQEVFDHADKIS